MAPISTEEDYAVNDGPKVLKPCSLPDRVCVHGRGLLHQSEDTATRQEVDAVITIHGEPAVIGIDCTEDYIRDPDHHEMPMARVSTEELDRATVATLNLFQECALQPKNLISLPLAIEAGAESVAGRKLLLDGAGDCVRLLKEAQLEVDLKLFVDRAEEVDRRRFVLPLLYFVAERSPARLEGTCEGHLKDQGMEVVYVVARVEKIGEEPPVPPSAVEEVESRDECIEGSGLRVSTAATEGRQRPGLQVCHGERRPGRLVPGPFRIRSAMKSAGSASASSPLLRFGRSDSRSERSRHSFSTDRRRPRKSLEASALVRSPKSRATAHTRSAGGIARWRAISWRSCRSFTGAEPTPRPVGAEDFWAGCGRVSPRRGEQVKSKPKGAKYRRWPDADLRA